MEGWMVERLGHGKLGRDGRIDLLVLSIETLVGVGGGGWVTSRGGGADGKGCEGGERGLVSRSEVR